MGSAGAEGSEIAASWKIGGLLQLNLA